MGSPSDSLDFCRRFFRGYVFDLWLADVSGKGYGNGGTLAFMLGTPRDGQPGLVDSVYAADCLLRAAEAEGVIKRVSHDPTRELQFFGCGGRAVRRGKPDRWSRPVEFGWVAIGAA